MMFTYIIIFLSIIKFTLNVSIPPSTIEIDLNEIVRLHKEFLDRSPSIPVYESYKLRCQAIDECCPDEKDELFTLFTESQFNENCLLNGTKLINSSVSSACLATLRQLIQLTKEPIYGKYYEVLGTNMNRLNRIQRWKKQMKMVCSNEELDAYYCERDNMDKFKSCQRKVLEMVANENSEDDDDGIIYKTYVSQWEQEYAIDNQKLIKAFSNN